MLGQREQLVGCFRVGEKQVGVVEGINQEEIDGLVEMKGPEVCKSKSKYCRSKTVYNLEEEGSEGRIQVYRLQRSSSFKLWYSPEREWATEAKRNESLWCWEQQGALTLRRERGHQCEYWSSPGLGWREDGCQVPRPSINVERELETRKWEERGMEMKAWKENGLFLRAEDKEMWSTHSWENLPSQLPSPLQYFLLKK